MKKRILLVALMIALFVCLFAISVSARVEDYDAEYTLATTESFTRYEKWFYNDGKSFVRKSYTDEITMTFVDEDGNTLTKVPMWEYDEEDGRYYSLVWYISAYEYVTEDGTYTDNNVGTQTYKIYKSATYTLSKVRAVDLRYYTYYVNRNNSNVPSWTENRSLLALEGIYLTNGTPDDTTDDIKLQDAVGIGRDTDNYGYFGWEAQFNATGDKIVVANFRDCTFECDMEGNYGTSNTWSSAFHLQCLWYPDSMKHILAGVNSLREIDLGDGMEIIACQILRDNKNVKEIVIPNSTLYIAHEAFRGSDLTKIVIGEGLIAHGEQPFLYTGAADITVISKNVVTSTTVNDWRFYAGRDSKQTIYVDGGLDVATAIKECLIANDNVFSYNGRIVIYDYNITQTRADTDKYTVIFYNYNRCEAFYSNIHQDNGNGCVDYCERCERLAQKAEEDKEHNYLKETTYTDIAKAGVVICTCQNENCTDNITPKEDVANPVFTYVGFSSDIATNSFITVGYLIDQEALAEYKSSLEAGVAFSFGFVGLATKADATLNTQPIDATTGKVTANNMMQVNLAEQEGIEYCTAVDFKIAGEFRNEVYAKAQLGMALYTSHRTTEGGTDTYAINYVVADGENASKSVSDIVSVTYLEKFPTQNEEVTE